MVLRVAQQAQQYALLDPARLVDTSVSLQLVTVHTGQTYTILRRVKNKKINKLHIIGFRTTYWYDY